MRHCQASLSSLSSFAKQGNVEAAQHLYHRLTPYLESIVRHVLSVPEAQSELERCIVAEAEIVLGLRQHQGESLTRASLTKEVTQRLQDRLFRNVQLSTCHTVDFDPHETKIHN